AEPVDGPVGFDPAAGDDEAADEVADVVQRRDPRTRSGSPAQGRDHQRQCGSVEEPAHPHCHRQAEPATEGNERVTAAVGHSGSSLQAADLRPYDAMAAGRSPRREVISRWGGWSPDCDRGKWLIRGERGRVIAVDIKRSIQGGVVALALLLAGCSWSDSDGSAPSADQTAEPSPTPTEFVQSFTGAVSGEEAT